MLCRENAPQSDGVLMGSCDRGRVPEDSWQIHPVPGGEGRDGRREDETDGLEDAAIRITNDKAL